METLIISQAPVAQQQVKASKVPVNMGPAALLGNMEGRHRAPRVVHLVIAQDRPVICRVSPQDKTGLGQLEGLARTNTLAMVLKHRYQACLHMKQAHKRSH